MKCLALTLLFAWAARAEGLQWERPTKVDVVMLLAVESLIVVDAVQTVRWCDRPEAVHCEAGLGALVMGTKPSTEAIIATSVGAGLLTVGIWYALPDPLRKSFTISIGVAEGLNVVWNTGFRF